MKYLLFSISFLMIIFPDNFCQEKGNTIYEHENIYLSFKNINFIKNNEYFNPIAEGYTLIGYFIQPSVVYSPSEKVKLQLGIHLLNYSGADKIYKSKLVFSTAFYLTDHTYLTLGTLNGSDKHRMLDPHFNIERLYTAYAEDGLQFVTCNDHFFSDTWLSWENFIFRGDTTREIFTSGESFKYCSGEIADIFKLEVPFQLQFKHYGGQISNYDEHVETYFNLATGLRINFDIDRERLGIAGLEYLQFIFNDFTNKNVHGISWGKASWIRFHYNYKSLYFGTYYWKSHDFFAPNGNGIYGSVSEVTKDLVVPDRAVWTNSLSLTLYPVGFLEFYLGFDAYFDLNRKHIDTALTLHLNFEKLIRLATLEH